VHRTLAFVTGFFVSLCLGANFGGSIGGSGSGDIISATSPLSVSNSNVSCQAASGSQAGCLSSADWSTFNGKIATVSADSPLTGAGTSASHLSCQASSGSQAGCLSSADWTTFNGKQGSVSFANLGSSPSAKGCDISSGTVTCQPADSTHPGMLGSGTTQTIKPALTGPGFGASQAAGGNGFSLAAGAYFDYGGGALGGACSSGHCLFYSSGTGLVFNDHVMPNGAGSFNLGSISLPWGVVYTAAVVVNGQSQAMVPETLLTSLDLGNVLAPASLTTEGSHTFLHAPTITQMTGYISLAGAVCSGNLTFAATDGTGTCTCAVAAASGTDTAWSCSGGLTGTCALSAGAVRFNLTGGTCTTQPKVENWDVVGHY
jgi:hypothetical protein